MSSSSRCVPCCTSMKNQIGRSRILDPMNLPMPDRDRFAGSQRNDVTPLCHPRFAGHDHPMLGAVRMPLQRKLASRHKDDDALDRGGPGPVVRISQLPQVRSLRWPCDRWEGARITAHPR